MQHVCKNCKEVIVYILLVCIVCSCSKHNSETTQPASEVTVTLDHTLPSLLQESSGLCFTDGSLWSFGDSGNPNAIYKIDTITGAILQTVIIQNFPNEDWEDITADDDYIYIGDFGNNKGNRKNLRILCIKKSDITTASQVNVNAGAISFSYTDQTDFTSNNNSNFNCEALVSIEDNLYIFTKDEGDLQTRCYQLSKTPGTYAVAPISSFNAGGEITSAAYNPVTKELALGGYEPQKQHPFIWFYKDYTGNHFFEGDKTKVTLSGDNKQWQTEGIDYTSSNTMFLSCESTPDIAASLYSLTLHFTY